MIDVGANLLDPMYMGVYHGKDTPYHPPDVSDVLERARAAGLTKIMVTAGTLAEARAAVAFCRSWNEKDSTSSSSRRLLLYTTVGVHPTRGKEWAADPAGYTAGLEAILREDAACASPVVVAIGECGLDYERVQFCDVETQVACFEEHFRLAEVYRLPMFLHSRGTEGKAVAMVDVLRRFAGRMVRGGVVHSFDGSAEEMAALVGVGCGERGEAKLYIGLNGCSLKTEDNLRVVKGLPLERWVVGCWLLVVGRGRERERETVVVTRFFARSLTRSLYALIGGRLMVETDAPWCGGSLFAGIGPSTRTHWTARSLAHSHTGIRPTHASYGYLKESLVGLPPQKDKKKWIQGGMVKGRNEPGCLGQVVEVVSGVMDVPVEAVKHAATKNAQDLFFS